MKSTRFASRIGGTLVLAFVLGCLPAGCAVVGPATIRSGRLAYNEAIAETNNQQMLMNIVHNRYEEQGALLAVASVTANVSIAANTGIQLGFGDDGNYEGNLVPFSTAVAYEENPTISYTPVEGEKYARQLFSPVPMTAFAQLVAGLTDPDYIYTALVSSVNGIHNPDFLFTSADSDPRFPRFVTLMTELTRAHRLHWVEDPQHAGRFSVVIHHYTPTHAAKVDELLDLLGLPLPKDHSTSLILPVSLALEGRDTGGIGITTHSVFDLVELLSAALDVPEEDQRNGVATRYPPPGLVGKELRISRATDRPKHAYVAVKHRDVWFYIDERDQATKRFFRLLSILWSTAIAESTGKASAAPVLTVPVSR
jgi:hypothetical protein